LYDTIDEPICPDLGHGLVPTDILISDETCLCDELLGSCTGVCPRVESGIECA
jgi:hypothetical protein